MPRRGARAIDASEGQPRRVPVVPGPTRDLALGLDGLPGILYERDAEGRFTFVSQQAASLLGYAAAEWLAPGFLADRLHPADRDDVLDACKGLAEGRREYRLVARDGRVVFVEDSAWAVQEEGEPPRVRGLLQDVTKRRNTERRLVIQQATTGILALAETVEEALPALLQAVAEPMGWVLAVHWRTERGRLRPASWWVAPGSGAEPLAEATRALSFAPGEGLPGRVLASGHADWLEAFGDQGLPRSKVASAVGVTSAVALPLRIRKEVHGVLEFFSREAVAREPEMVLALQAVGSQVALFIERRAAASDLRESDARKGALLEVALDAIVTIDHEGLVREWNPAAEQTFGYSREEALGRPLADLIIPPNMRERHRAGFSRHLATGESRILGQRVEVPAQRKDGARIDVELAVMRVPVEGSPVFTAFIRDVTQRRRAQAELVFQKALLEAQMEASIDAIAVLDLEDRVVARNRRFDETFGPGEGFAPRILAQVEDAAAFEAGMRRLHEVPDAVIRDEVRLKDGRVLERHGAAIRGPDGAQHGRTWSFRDVTERRRVQETLAHLLAEVDQQRRRLNAIVASVPGVVWETWETPDPAANRTDFVSEHVETMLGYSAKEWLATPGFWLMLVHPDDREEAARRVAEMLETGKGGTLTFRWRRRDGAYVWAQSWNAVIRDESDRPVGLRGVTLDVSERKAAEEALLRSDERLRLLTRATNDVIWDWDLQTGSLWWNESFSTTFGYAPHEVEGNAASWAQHVHPDDRPHVQAGLAAALGSDATTWSDEYRFRRKDGAYAIVLDRGFILRDEKGRAFRIVGSMMDVTARRRAESELRESEARYRFLADAVPEQVWTAMPDGRLDYANRRMTEYLGETAERVVGNGWQAMVHPDDRPGVALRWSRSVETGEAYEAEFRLRRADGAWRWHIGRALPLRDARGNVLKWFGANADIEDLKRLTAELEYQRDLTQTITDNAASALFLMDAEGRAVFMNRAATRMTGYASVEEMEGKRLHDAIHPLRPLWDQRDVFARKDGTPFPVEYNVAPLGREGHHGAVVEVRDITESMRAEQELKTRAEELARLAEALQRTNRELDQFAYITSHDLKAPLRGISNLSRWIEEDVGDRLTDEARGHLELMRGRVMRMESLIDAILAYSRAGRVKGKPEKVDVGALLRETIDLASPPPEFRVEAATDLPTLVADRTRLQQVFLNLISNAVKHHGRKDGRVTVTWEDAGPMVRFAVSDDGPGIDPRFHDRIFLIFQTLQPRDKVEGTGIGLALVKKIVESHGGTIQVESEEGKGATFRFTWPKVTKGD